MNFENNNINENKKLEYINDKAKMWLTHNFVSMKLGLYNSWDHKPNSSD